MSISKAVKQVEVRDSIVEGLIIVNYPATRSSTYYIRGTYPLHEPHIPSG